MTTGGGNTGGRSTEAGDRVDSQSSLHRLYNEGSLRGGMKLNRRVECEVMTRAGNTAVPRFCQRQRGAGEFIEAKAAKTY